MGPPLPRRLLSLTSRHPKPILQSLPCKLNFNKNTIWLIMTVCNLAQPPARCPRAVAARGFGISKSLLLFSTDDLLISAPSVRAFGDMLDAAADEAGEPPSQRTEWKRSAHVQHYRHHPEDYRATVDDFWSDVLRNG